MTVLKVPSDRFVYEYIYCLGVAICIFVLSLVIAQVLERNAYINRFIFGKVAK